MYYDNMKVVGEENDDNREHCFKTECASMLAL